jgi:hypothetical protein
MFARKIEASLYYLGGNKNSGAFCSFAKKALELFLFPASIFLKETRVK